MIIVLLVGAGGMFVVRSSLVRARRQRKLLTRDPWRQWGLRYRELPGPRGSVRALVLIGEHGSEHLLALAGLLRSELGRSGWIWGFNEPDGGDPAYATVAVGHGGTRIVGYETGYYRLTPEQFILGDYHQVFDGRPNCRDGRLRVSRSPEWPC